MITDQDHDQVFQLITDQDYEAALRALGINQRWSKIRERAAFLANMRAVDEAYQRLNEIIVSTGYTSLQGHQQAILQAARVLKGLIDLHCPLVSP